MGKFTGKPDQFDGKNHGFRLKFSQQNQSSDLRYNNLTGDVLISSGIIAYLGCFLAKYRNESVDSWISLMQDLTDKKDKKTTIVGAEKYMETWDKNGILTHTPRIPNL